MNILDVKLLSKKYKKRSIHNISFKMSEGEVLSVVGPSNDDLTLIYNILLGFQKQNSGSASIFNLDTWKNSAKIKKRVAGVPIDIHLDDRDRISTFLKRNLSISGIKDHEDIRSICQRFHLNSRSYISDLSYEERRTVSVINGLIRNPDLLIINEVIDLDIDVQNNIIDFINKGQSQNKSILLLTKDLEFAQNVSDRILYVLDGSIIRHEIVSEVFSHDKIIRIYDSNINLDPFIEVGGFILNKENREIFYNKDLTVVTDILSRLNVKDYLVLNANLEEKLAYLKSIESDKSENNTKRI